MITFSKHSWRGVFAVVTVLVPLVIAGPRPLTADAVGVPGPAVGLLSASSTSAGSSAAALGDGSFSAGVPGGSWVAAAGDATPWVQTSWTTARRIASVQVLGPAGTAGATPLAGRLEFSDGSSVAVPGVASGADPTTVAFTPRTVRWVRMTLSRSASGTTAMPALQEFAAYEAGTTPPRWPRDQAGYAVNPPAASCSGAPVSASVAGGLSLVCPTPGALVSGTGKVVVAADPGTKLVLRGSRLDKGQNGRGAVWWLAAATANPSGRATFTFRTSVLPRGPVGLRVNRQDGTGLPLHVQLINGSGRTTTASSTVPAGMNLVYDEGFGSPLAVSQSGAGADYAATKPEAWGSSQFGAAVFADPAVGAGSLATVPGGYLRVRVQPVGGFPVRTDWGQQHIGGILSSSRIGGSGFSAQYGYFEARMLGAPGPGTWPSFWMLNAESATPRGAGSSAEVDAVELYGHDTATSCHTSHSWVQGKGDVDGVAGPCGRFVVPQDWAMDWHTYGARVRPGSVTLFVDGVEVATLGNLSHTEEPFFFLLDLALGGGWPVDLRRTGNLSDLYVDWVRVYV